MKQILKVLLCITSFQAPVFASYAPLTGTEDQSKRLLELAPRQIDPTAPPIVQRDLPPAAVPVQPPINRRCIIKEKYIFCMGTLIAAAVIAIPTYYLVRSKPASTWYPCADSNDDMSKKCSSIKISDCGSCTKDIASHASCGYRGHTTAGQLIANVSQMLSNTCGMQASYCVSEVPCQESIWICDTTDTLTGLKNFAQEKCAPQKPQHLRTKFMKRSNNRRKK